MRGLKNAAPRACLAIVFAGTVFLAEPAYAGDLHIGAGKVSVTPSPADFPYPPSDTPSLNTGPGEHDFVGVHDDVYARAMVMDDGAHRTALVVLDTTAIPAAQDIAGAVAKQIGAPISNVMVAATHTHDVPLFSYAGGRANAREQREIERLKQGELDAVRIATAHLQPARVAFGRGKAWVNVNNGEQSGSSAGYDPRGPSDKTLDVVQFESAAGVPIALLVNYASHGEVMFRSITKDNGYEVSGDLPGAVSRLLESAFGSAPVVLFTSGAEADQLTLFKSLQRAGRLPGADEGAAGWALLDVQARRLGESVMSVLATMPPSQPGVPLRAATGEVTCPGQQLRIDHETGHVTTQDRPAVTIPLSMIGVGDIIFAGIGGDVASEIGGHVKAASPMKDTTLITMVGNSIGYIFADASYEYPGHGLTKSPLKPHCANQSIVSGLTRLIKHTTP